MENIQKDLVEELISITHIVKENPCGMSEGLLSALREVIHSFIGKQCLKSASKDQVAIYLRRDVRTITRWMKDYPDFPSGRHRGHHDIEFDWIEVAKWKLKHKELYED